MRLIQRHAIWLVLATLIGLAGAWIVLSLNPVAYTSTASVDVEPRIITGSTPVVPNLVTEERVAASGAVLNKAAPLLAMTTTDLVTHLAATVPGTSTILQISCTMPTAVGAQHCANVVTSAYINFRNATDATSAVQARDPLQVTLVSAAPLPASPTGSKKPELIAIGALLGLLIGVGAVYARDRADDRVRDRADLSLNLGAPALVEIPPAERKAGSAAFAFAKTPASRAAEAYRYLRIRIDGLAPAPRDAKGYVVLVTAPRGGEGSTSVSSNLATALAQGGAKVLLVDGDVRDASLSLLYGKGGRTGLADLLTGRSSHTDVAQFTIVPRLTLLPAGQPRSNPAEMLEPGELARVFAALSTTADVVVVDSGPVLAVSDPIALASVSDVVVVVADPRRTTRADLRAVAREISSSGKRHVVGVLNNVPGMRAGRSAPARQQGSAEVPKEAVLPQTVNAQTLKAQTVNANNDGGAGRPDSHESGA
jgi:succinoglycan biosynthesis transport protein ExoP